MMMTIRARTLATVETTCRIAPHFTFIQFTYVSRPVQEKHKLLFINQQQKPYSINTTEWIHHTFITQFLSNNIHILFLILTHTHNDLKDRLAYNEGSKQADGVIGSRTGWVERLDEVVGEGQRDHRLTGWFHHQQGRPKSAEKVAKRTRTKDVRATVGWIKTNFRINVPLPTE